MVKEVEVPFYNLKDLIPKYGKNFLVLTNCPGVEEHDWDHTGVLRLVCDTYQECLKGCHRFYSDFEKYGSIVPYMFSPRENELYGSDA